MRLLHCPRSGNEPSGSKPFKFGPTSPASLLLRDHDRAVLILRHRDHSPTSDGAESFVEVPLDTPLTALEPYVSKAIGPLFSKFDGYEAPQALVESCVRMLVERKMQ